MGLNISLIMKCPQLRIKMDENASDEATVRVLKQIFHCMNDKRLVCGVEGGITLQLIRSKLSSDRSELPGRKTHSSAREVKKFCKKALASDAKCTVQQGKSRSFVRKL